MFDVETITDSGFMLIPQDFEWRVMAQERKFGEWYSCLPFQRCMFSFADSNIRLPGRSAMEPRIFKFGTPYEEMYNNLSATPEDEAFFVRNGVLDLCRRGAAVKKSPQRWQDQTSEFICQHHWTSPRSGRKVSIVFINHEFSVVVPAVVVYDDKSNNYYNTNYTYHQNSEVCRPTNSKSPQEYSNHL